MGFPEIEMNGQARVDIRTPKNVASTEADSINRRIELLTRLAGNFRERTMVLAVKLTRLFLAQPIADDHGTLATTNVGIAAGVPVSLEMADAHSITNFESGPIPNCLD